MVHLYLHREHMVRIKVKSYIDLFGGFTECSDFMTSVHWKLQPGGFENKHVPRKRLIDATRRAC